MTKWRGAAAICINDKNELLMVAQEKSNESELWSVPSGGIESYETYEECCIREVWEETGYTVSVMDKVCERDTVTYDVNVHIKYFEVKLLGGERKIQDPDELILDICWQPLSELVNLKMLFEDERQILLDYIQKKEGQQI
ncbi:DNA mismatch repair protein MutT [Priestia megaterium]|uniref:NUDIX hydrolase n=1 Tax=Priestia megaterium TaxID=1404 RepID=UPI000BF89FEF|nr:NUDIX hydrolase [Priestia megaterium]PEU53159.1 DNA mismatch repair protein MutT [Priestia megaterium]